MYNIGKTMMGSTKDDNLDIRVRYNNFKFAHSKLENIEYILPLITVDLYIGHTKVITEMEIKEAKVFVEGMLFQQRLERGCINFN